MPCFCDDFIANSCLQELPPYSNAWCDVDEHCPDARKYCKVLWWDCHYSADCTMGKDYTLSRYGFNYDPATGTLLRVPSYVYPPTVP